MIFLVALREEGSRGRALSLFQIGCPQEVKGLTLRVLGLAQGSRKHIGKQQNARFFFGDGKATFFVQAALQNNLKPGAPTSTTAQPLRQHPDNKHLHQTLPTTTNKQTTSKEYPSNTHPRLWGQGWEARGKGSRASPGCRSLRSSTAGMFFILAAANPDKDPTKKGSTATHSSEPSRFALPACTVTEVSARNAFGYMWPSQHWTWKGLVEKSQHSV